MLFEALMKSPTPSRGIYISLGCLTSAEKSFTFSFQMCVLNFVQFAYRHYCLFLFLLIKFPTRTLLYQCLLHISCRHTHKKILLFDVASNCSLETYQSLSISNLLEPKQNLNSPMAFHFRSWFQQTLPTESFSH